MLFNRGMTVGLQETVLAVSQELPLSPAEIEKVVKELKSSPAIIDDAAKEILIDKGSILSPAYDRGFQAGHEYFLEQFTSLNSRSRND